MLTQKESQSKAPDKTLLDYNFNGKTLKEESSAEEDKPNEDLSSSCDSNETDETKNTTDVKSEHCNKHGPNQTVGSTDRSKAIVPVLVSLSLCGLFYEAICLMSSLVLFCSCIFYLALGRES